MESLDVVLEIGDDLASQHEAIRVVAVVLGAREPGLPVGCVECERVPAVIAPSLARPVRLLEDEMVAAFPGQVVADRKPGLSAADDDCVDVRAYGISSGRQHPAVQSSSCDTHG